MNEGDAGAVIRDMMIVVLKLGGPALLAGLVTGVIMAMVQAVTQINEPTLAFVPKVVVITGVLALTGPYMLAALTDYSGRLFDQMVAAGGQ